MPIEIAALAASVVTSFLLPYVKEGAANLAKVVTQKASDTAAKHVVGVAEKLWHRVSSLFSSEAEKATVSDFEKYPEETKPLLIRKLGEKIEQDPKLAEELEGLVKSPSPDGLGTSIHIMADKVGYVDARYAQISGGIVAGYYDAGSSPATPTTPPSDPNKKTP